MKPCSRPRPAGGRRTLRLSLGLAALLLAAAGARAQTPQYAAPRLLNVDSVAAAVRREYPFELLRRQIGRVVHVRLHITETGAVDSMGIAESTGDSALDNAALRVARIMRFSPAVQRGQAVPLRIVLPVQFEARAIVTPTLAKSWKPQRVALLNRAALEDSVRARYPGDARRAGIRARVTLRLLVDAAGEVRDQIVDSTSCFPFLDQQAEALAGRMRFAPARSIDLAVRLTAIALTFGRDSNNVQFPGDSVSRRPEGADTTRRKLHVPKVMNRDALATVKAGLEDASAGAGGVRKGKTIFWALVDEGGNVVSRELTWSSGTCTLDLAMLRAVEVVRFSPGTVNGRPIKMWVELPFKWRGSDPGQARLPPTIPH